VIPYAERVCFTPSHLDVLTRTQALVARVSDAWGNELRCHELARAVQLVLAHEQRIEVVDGKCGPVEHSWLCFPDGVILDVYAPGRLPAVQIVDPIVGAQYRPGSARHDVQQSIIERLLAEMRGAIPVSES
jgi:hypothetical protein